MWGLTAFPVARCTSVSRRDQNPTSLLLRAYYERLHDLMVAHRSRLLSRIDDLLEAEITRRDFGDIDTERRAAYREACVAFIDERIESYNPIGIQYTFQRNASRSRIAAELEFELSWYNSRREFSDLVATARSLAGPTVSDEDLPELAAELIRGSGAWPDRSIIAAYRAEPTLQKLPDYIVACVVEEIICGRDPENG